MMTTAALHGTEDDNAPQARGATDQAWSELLNGFFGLGIDPIRYSCSAKYPQFGNFTFKVRPTVEQFAEMITIAKRWATDMGWWKVELEYDPEYRDVRLNAYMRRYLEKPF